MSRDITQLYQFTVRLENGMVYSKYVASAATAAAHAQSQYRQETGGGESPAVLVLRADEPFYRKRSTLRRLLDWWES